jgi:hypothetical protein
VHGVYALAIRETSNDGFAGWAHVGHGGSGHEKMICCARVQDGPCRMVSMSILTVRSSAAEASAYFGVRVG